MSITITGPIAYIRFYQWGFSMVGASEVFNGLGELLLDDVAVKAYIIPANFVGSVASCVTGPDDVAVFNILKNDVQAGTMTVAIDGTVTFASVGGLVTNVAIGDVISLRGPNIVPTGLIRFRCKILGAF